MTHADLVTAARNWLYTRCSVVVTDMVSGAAETPDAIGWQGWHSHLVECKASVSDFRADAQKPHRTNVERGMGVFRWYLAPAGLIPIAALPEKWGLLEVAGGKIRKARHADQFACDREAEILLLLSALRRIGQTCPEGVSIKCYTIPTKRRAELSVEALALKGDAMEAVE